MNSATHVEPAAPPSYWMPTPRRGLAIALWYAVAGFVWIGCSGWVLHRWVHNEALVALLEYLKGCTFVLITALLLGLVLERHFRESRRYATVIQRNQDLLLEMGRVAKIGAWELDPITGQGAWTDEVARIHGVDPGQSPNRDLGLAFYTAESRPLIEAALQAALREGTPYDLELEIVTTAGQRKYVRTACQPLMENGKVVRLRGCFQDITALKQKEEAAAAAHERARLALDAAGAGTWEWDLETGKNAWSAEIWKLYGLTPGQNEPSYETWMSTIHAEDRDAVEATLRETIARRTELRIEWRAVEPGGHVRWLMARGGPLKNQAGRVVSYLGVVMDISDRRRMEAELRDSEARYRLISENASDVIWLFDLGRARFTYVSPAVTRLRGFAVEEVLGGTLQDALAPESYQMIAAVLPKIVEAFAAGDGSVRTHTTEVMLRHKDGPPVSVEVATTFITDPQGRPTHIQGVTRDISARKRAEEALRESDRLLHTVMDLVPHFIFAKDHHGAYLVVNRAYAVANGLTPEEMIGKHDLEVLTDWEEAKTVMQQDREVIESGKPKFISQDGFTDASGQVRILQTIKIPFETPGAGTGVVCVAVDITGLKRAEAALRQSESEFRVMFENAMIGMAQVDAGTGRWVRANQRLSAITGFSEIELRTMDVPAIVHPEERSLVRGVLQQLYAGEAQERTFETRGLRKDGTGVWLRLNITLIREAGGQPSRTMATVEDISQQRRDAERVRQLSRAVEQSPSSIVITDTSGAIQYVNPRFVETTGYTLEEVQGKNPRILKSGEMAATEYERLWRTILRGDEWRGEFHNRKKNGDLYWESASVSPITDDRGVITHFVATKEDTTARRQLEAELRQAQKLEAVAQLAGGVAHDFNNILAAILMQVGLLREEPGLPSEVCEGLQDVEVEAQRAATLTRRLLMFSRRSILDMRVLDLNALAANMLKMLRRIIGEQIEIRFGPVDGLPSIRADAGMLEQVLLNLAVNARDAMPSGGVITISTSIADLDETRASAFPDRRPGRFVCLSVADTGCGMDPATARRIFEPFFTTKGPGKGTGLGLSTVHGIVGQHKGWIEVETEPAKGSLFRVLLPALDAAAATEAESSPAPLMSYQGHETILLVEDEEAVRRNIAQLLQLLGYHLLQAQDGREALVVWAAEGARVDLLLTDMVMPGGLTGLDLAQRFQADKPDLKVIVSSGYSHEIVQAGQPPNLKVVYVPKPYDARTLGATLRACLAGGSTRN